jgi:hypothetical protein
MCCDYSLPPAWALRQPRRVLRLLVTRSHALYFNLAVHRDYSSLGHELYVNLAVRRDYSSPTARALPQPCRAPRLLVSGCTRSTSTLPCAATTRHPATHALRRPRRAPRVLVSTLPAAAIYLDYAGCPGASARRAAHRRLLRLAQARCRLLHRASGCLGMSRGSSRG